ncbi:MAG: galactitol-1-phosphate 5-dehydrogenase [Verrucomicrobiota bacterium]
MKALLLTAPAKLELVEFPTPQAGNDEVLIRVRACGICGSDIHGWDGSSGRRNPPLIMGHEASGEIVATGAGVTRWQAGDRVTFDSTIYCGECDYCRSGQVNLCGSRRVIGVSPPEYKQHGAFAEYVAVPERILYRLPDGLDYAHAAMVEPVAIAIHAIRRVPITAASATVVVGAGMIGLFIVQALRWAGARRIIAVDLEPNRLALAKELGATDVLLSDARAAVPDEIARLTGGHGADAVFEAVGISPTVPLALRTARRGGAVVLVGNLARQTDFPLQSVVTRELSIFGSCSSAGEYPLCIDLITRGIIKVAPMISARAPLAEGAGWFQKLSARGGGKYFKIILQP